MGKKLTAIMLAAGFAVFSPPGAPGARGAVLPPGYGCYTGVFPGWGEHEDDVTAGELENLEQLTGKAVAFSPFSVFWGEQTVSGEQLEAMGRYGAVPMLRLMPWGEPYWTEGYQPAYSLQKIIDGDFDVFLSAWADRVKAFGRPVMVNFGVEMNGDWFPWSGTYQGGAAATGYGDPTKADGPERFVDAFRHIVDLFRTRGADNVTWYFHANHESFPDEPWNSIAAYYPGDGYVDWLGFSVYGVQYADEDWESFEALMTPAYSAICALSAEKPLILAEWGVGEYPLKGDKAAWYTGALASLPSVYPRVRVAVVYSERWENDDGSWSDLRINSSPAAWTAYTAGIASDYYRGRPEAPPVLAGGDYDGDGTADIAIFRGETGLWAVRGVTRSYFGDSGTTTAPGDYDGNGSAEIAVFRSSAGLWAVRGLTRAYFGRPGDQPVPGDYDGAGGADIAIFRSSGGLWTARGITRAYFGSSLDTAVPEDYNGDGAFDLAVFRSANGLWAVRGISRFYFGSGQPVPGDFDGDGTAEAGIFRPAGAGGLWAIRGITRAYFGSGNDRPVPAGYSGNGNQEIGIFRAASGLWAIRGVTRLYFGSAGDIPVTR
ncbi:MAG: glycosyl hydrolase [PVC group bacterium]